MWTERGDAISVEMIPFSTSAADQAADALGEAADAAEAEKKAEQFKQILALGFFLVAALAGVLIYAVRNRRRKKTSIVVEETEVPFKADYTVTPLESVAETVMTPIIDPIPEPEMTEAIERREQISALATNNPQKTAEFMRGMMDEKGPR